MTKMLRAAILIISLISQWRCIGGCDLCQRVINSPRGDLFLLYTEREMRESGWLLVVLSLTRLLISCFTLLVAREELVFDSFLLLLACDKCHRKIERDKSERGLCSAGCCCEWGFPYVELIKFSYILMSPLQLCKYTRESEMAGTQRFRKAL
jgi:hypothetical protein